MGRSSVKSYNLPESTKSWFMTFCPNSGQSLVAAKTAILDGRSWPPLSKLFSASILMPKIRSNSGRTTSFEDVSRLASPVPWPFHTRRVRVSPSQSGISEESSTLSTISSKSSTVWLLEAEDGSGLLLAGSSLVQPDRMDAAIAVQSSIAVNRLPMFFTSCNKIFLKQISAARPLRIFRMVRGFSADSCCMTRKSL